MSSGIVRPVSYEMRTSVDMTGRLESTDSRLDTFDLPLPRMPMITMFADMQP